MKNILLETSGNYGDMSFVVFSADASGPPLIGMVVGTQSIAGPMG